MANINKENIILFKSAIKLGIAGSLPFIIFYGILIALMRNGIDLIRIIRDVSGLNSEILSLSIVLYGFLIGVLIFILTPGDKMENFRFKKSLLVAIFMSAIVMIALFIYPIYNTIWAPPDVIQPLSPGDVESDTPIGLLFIMASIIYFTINILSVLFGSIVSFQVLRLYNRCKG